MSRPPAASVDDKPADVIDRAGAWFASELHGFRWVKTRRELRRKDGDAEVCLRLQASSGNRSGTSASVSPRLSMTDRVLTRWRSDHDAAGAAEAWVFNTALGDVTAEWARVECYDVRQRPDAAPRRTAQQFLDDVRDRVLPMLAMFRTPAVAASEVSGAWTVLVCPGTVEWALAHGDARAAALFVRTFMARPLAGAGTWETRLEAFTRGWSAVACSADLAETEIMGWLSRRHGLVSPADLVPPEDARAATRAGHRRWWSSRRR